jgi:hypothetical protein
MLKKEINRLAWSRALDYYEDHRSELMQKAGVSGPRGYRRRSGEINQGFHIFVVNLLDEGVFDDVLEGVDDPLKDLIEAFLNKPTVTNRVALYGALKERPRLLGERLAEFIKFA